MGNGQPSAAQTFRGLVSYPKTWKSEKRGVLNARKFCLFTSNSPSQPSACERVAALLQRALALAEMHYNEGEKISALSSGISSNNSSSSGSGSGSGDSMANEWISFMNKAAELQSLELNTASDTNSSDDDKLCLFLNLYHVMVIHATLVYGLPKTLSEWNRVFNRLSYECFGDVLTIAELEHRILKRGLSKPKKFLLSTFLPNGEWKFSCKVNDLRLLWAINCGSPIMGDTIPIYKPETLHQQLNDTSCELLSKQVTFNGSTLTFPEICKWYTQDYDDCPISPHTPKLDGISLDPDVISVKNSSVSMLSHILPYCSSDLRSEFSDYLDRGGSVVNVKYHGWNFNSKALVARTSAQSEKLRSELALRLPLPPSPSNRSHPSNVTLNVSSNSDGTNNSENESETGSTSTSGSTSGSGTVTPFDPI
jgi:hypothetical protein